MDLPPVPYYHQSVSLYATDELQLYSSLTYVTTGEISTLKHEVWDYTMELAARVSEALLASAESTEVLGRLWDDIIEELEVDAAGACCRSLKSAYGQA